jgi:hypothetical protein
MMPINRPRDAARRLTRFCAGTALVVLTVSSNPPRRQSSGRRRSRATCRRGACSSRPTWS